MKITKKDIEESYLSLSKEIKIILNSEIVKEELESVLKEVVGNEGKNKEKINMVFLEISLIIIGFTEKKNLVDKIENIFGIDTGKAEMLIRKIDKIVFERIRNVEKGLKGDFLNIDNNVDFFSDNRKDIVIKLPKNIEKKIDYSVNYDEYYVSKKTNIFF